MRGYIKRFLHSLRLLGGDLRHGAIEWSLRLFLNGELRKGWVGTLRTLKYAPASSVVMGWSCLTRIRLGLNERAILRELETVVKEDPDGCTLTQTPPN